MIRRLRNKKYFRSILIAVLLLTILATGYLRYIPGTVERYYSLGFFPAICTLLQPVSGLVPFSLGDIFYAGLVLFMVYSFFKLLRLLFKKAWRQAWQMLLKGIITLQLLILVFYLFWGINYFRQPAAERLGLQDTSYTTENLLAVTSMLIDSANACRDMLTKADFDQSDAAISGTAKQAIRSLSKTNGFLSFYPTIKPSFFSAILNYTGTAGYYNPFTSEAQINNQMPVFLKPVVACHEMSHQTGFAAEDEANFAGFLAGTESGDKLLNYSAYYLAVAECMHDMRRRDSTLYNQLKLHISPEVLADFKTDRDYWMKYQGRIGAVTDVFFNNYLKANNQPEGMRRYNLMVRLTVAWYRKKGLLRSPQR